MGITIEKKKLAGGRMALYLNYSFQKKRWRESLNLILEAPVSPDIRKKNKEKLQLASTIRSKREIEIVENCYSVRNPYQERYIDWFELYHTFIQNYRGRDIRMVKASLFYLKNYAGERHLPSSQLNKQFCQGFYEYLKDHLSGNTPTGYFKKFKQCLEYGVDNQLLPANPASGIRLQQQNEITKSILNSKELSLLASTPCIHKEVKRAFLFSCYTGLRWCDIITLNISAIDFPNRMLHLEQNKVKRHSSKSILHLALNNTAIRLLKAKKHLPDGRIFDLPSYSYSNRVLKGWVITAGIPKKITFHCARHSFVTNLMLNGANIKTASELAGHSTIRHTEKYVHIVDEIKREAVNSLPDIKIIL